MWFKKSKNKSPPPLKYHTVDSLYRNFAYVFPVNENIAFLVYNKEYEILQTWCAEHSYTHPLVDTAIFDERVLERWESNIFGSDKIFLATNDYDAYIIGLLRWG